MNRSQWNRFWMFSLALAPLVIGHAETTPSSAESAVESADVAPSDDAYRPKDEMEPMTQPKATKKATKRRITRADAFVASADWEFDGFVSGGQDQAVRSMFYINDLIYLNIGAQQGLTPGDQVGVYKRGNKIRDPQTGKPIGYEVRRAALARVSDRVEDGTCAVRITNTYEAVEIGDLVRREE
jgi:hypothetical protein